MKRILVTGASGQLGSSIQHIASEYSSLHFMFTDSQNLDITNSEKVNSYFEACNFDWCINCAAYTNVEQAEILSGKAFEINAKGVKFLALACKQNKISLIHISTDHVFEGEKEVPYTVDDMPNPIYEYGKSKLQGKKYIQEILKNYFIIQTSWLYSEFKKNFYTTIMEYNLKDKIRLEKVGNYRTFAQRPKNSVLA